MSNTFFNQGNENGRLRFSTTATKGEGEEGGRNNKTSNMLTMGEEEEKRNINNNYNNNNNTNMDFFGRNQYNNNTVGTGGYTSFGLSTSAFNTNNNKNNNNTTNKEEDRKKYNMYRQEEQEEEEKTNKTPPPPPTSTGTTKTTGTQQTYTRPAERPQEPGKRSPMDMLSKPNINNSLMGTIGKTTSPTFQSTKIQYGGGEQKGGGMTTTAAAASAANIDHLLKEFRKELDSIKNMDIVTPKKGSAGSHHHHNTSTNSNNSQHSKDPYSMLGKDNKDTISGRYQAKHAMNDSIQPDKVKLGPTTYFLPHTSESEQSVQPQVSSLIRNASTPPQYNNDRDEENEKTLGSIASTKATATNNTKREMFKAPTYAVPQRSTIMNTTSARLQELTERKKTGQFQWKPRQQQAPQQQDQSNPQVKELTRRLTQAESRIQQLESQMEQITQLLLNQ